MYKVKAYGQNTYGLTEIHDFCSEHSLEYVLSFRNKDDSFDVSVLIPSGIMWGDDKLFTAMNINGVHNLKDCLPKLKEIMEKT